MFRTLLGMFLLSSLLFSCTKGYDSHVSLFHEDGRIKPKVCFVSVFNPDLIEDKHHISKKLPYQVFESLAKKNSFSITNIEKLDSNILALAKASFNLFQSEQKILQETFEGKEFIVFTELIQYDLHQKPLKNNFLDKITPSLELSMSMRVQVFDIRNSKPVVILQEIVTQNHLISSLLHKEFGSAPFLQKVSFELSLMGIAHSQFCKEVSKQIQDYILLAQNHS